MLRVIKNLIFYPLGILILILGISFFTDSVVGGLLLLVAGLLTLPVVNKKIVECTNEKLKGWKYVAVTLLAFFIGAAVLPSDTSTDASNTNSTEAVNRNNVNVSDETVSSNNVTKKPQAKEPQTEEPVKKSDSKKIDKNFQGKKYSDLVEMYAGLSDADKAYFTEKLESHVIEQFKNFEKDNKKTIEEVEILLEEFESIDTDSELITLIQSLLQDLETYESQKSELKSVTSVIPSGSIREELDVYLTQRIGNSSSIGEKYTDYYVAYPYTYSFNKAYPDYDAEPVILYSEQPLKEGVGTYYCARSGSYKTINFKGFEENNPKYDVYSSAEWDKYYEKESNDTQVRELNERIDAMHEKFSKLSGKDTETAKNILKELILLDQRGNWSDADHNITMWISSYVPGEYEIYISQQLETTEDLDAVTLRWTIKNVYYDEETGTLVYGGGVCEKEELGRYYPGHPRESIVETLYTNGKGKVFVKDGFVYWEDDKEKDSTNYKFEFTEYDYSLEDYYDYEGYYYNDYDYDYNYDYEW